MAVPLRMPTTTTMTAEPGSGAAALYRLLAWLSPSFPVGAFSYSHGLEAAAAAGAVHDRASLEAWIAAIVALGSGRIDADILCQAYRAARAGDDPGMDAANRRGLAFRATAELALEAAQQGEAFLAAWRGAWSGPHPPAADAAGPPSPAVRERDLNGAVPLTLSRTAGEGAGGHSPTAGEGICHSAVFGAATARAGIALDDALLGYLQAFAANLMSAGLRLGLIGQTDGQRILAALEPLIAQATAAAQTRDPADFGAATFAVDLASMAHETQYSRLFRS
jgi:urease accessory protein